MTEYLENLKKLRGEIVAKKRNSVSTALVDETTGLHKFEFYSRIQREIDSAIEDEEKLQPSIYETRDLVTI